MADVELSSLGAVIEGAIDAELGTTNWKSGTNLSATASALALTVESSTGTDVTLPAATAGAAGVFPAADKAAHDMIVAAITGANSYTPTNYALDLGQSDTFSRNYGGIDAELGLRLEAADIAAGAITPATGALDLTGTTGQVLTLDASGNIAAADAPGTDLSIPLHTASGLTIASSTGANIDLLPTEGYAGQAGLLSAGLFAVIDEARGYAPTHYSKGFAGDTMVYDLGQLFEGIDQAIGLSLASSDITSGLITPGSGNLNLTGTDGQVLTIDASGNMGFADAPAGSSTTFDGGTYTNIIFGTNIVLADNGDGTATANVSAGTATLGDGDYGDVTVSGGGTVLTVDAVAEAVVTAHEAALTIANTQVTGLGTAATTDSSAYATAAQGALADTALQEGDVTGVSFVAFPASGSAAGSVGQFSYNDTTKQMAVCVAPDTWRFFYTAGEPS